MPPTMPDTQILSVSIDFDIAAGVTINIHHTPRDIYDEFDAPEKTRHGHSWKEFRLGRNFAVTMHKID